MFLTVLALLASFVSAQTTRYNVNVYSDPQPYVEYTQPMGNTYQRMMQMYQDADRNAIERERIQLERERMRQAEMMESARISAATRAEGQKIVSNEILTLLGKNLATNAVVQIKARVIKRNNGNVDISCLGIKIGNNWKPCEKPISSLQEMYHKTTSEEEKSMVLGLMDLGNYLLDTGSEIYILK